VWSILGLCGMGENLGNAPHNWKLLSNSIAARLARFGSYACSGISFHSRRLELNRWDVSRR